MSKIAVVIGRFQVPFLTSGHRGLFNEIITDYNPNRFFVGIGVAPAKLTKNNPLDFSYRKDKVSEYLSKQDRSDSIIVPILDTQTDKEWYANLETLIKTMFPSDEVHLFGGRDSFLDKYTGTLPFTILDLKDTESATKTREFIGKNGGNDSEFARGIIYTLQNQYPKVYPTVDIAIIRNDAVLLGRKPTEDKVRFIGGFVDPLDMSLEAAAAREAKEEANLEINTWDSIEHQFTYLSSHLMDDWRYKHTPDKIHTTFFIHEIHNHLFVNNLRSGDDIAELTWFELKDLSKIDIMPVHKELQNDLVRWWLKKSAFKQKVLTEVTTQTKK